MLEYILEKRGVAVQKQWNNDNSLEFLEHKSVP